MKDRKQKAMGRCRTCIYREDASLTGPRSSQQKLARNYNPGKLDGTMASGGGGGQTVLGTLQDVVLMNSGDNNRAPKVYGSMTITVDGADPLIAFQKTREEAVNVPENGDIPLHETQFRTKRDSPFQFNVKLSDAIKEGPPDPQIMDGSVTFTSITDGCDSKFITGPDGGKVMRVDIIWSTPPTPSTYE